jgi:ribosome maturation factor RimP
MARRETYEQRTQELIMPVIKENNFELVDVEFVKEASNWYLRLYVDKEGGITINDCELVSRAMSDILDKEDYIEESYILEVSSPGLGRPLKKDKDFARSIDSEVEVKLFKAMDGCKEFTGILKSYDKNNVTIETDNNELLQIDRTNIALIRLAFDF